MIVCDFCQLGSVGDSRTRGRNRSVGLRLALVDWIRRELCREFEANHNIAAVQRLQMLVGGGCTAESTGVAQALFHVRNLP